MSDNPEKNTSPSKSSDDSRQPEPGRAPAPSPGRPPAATLIFWVMVLIAIPMALVFFFKKDNDQVLKLSQSKFETWLADKKIETVKVTTEPQTGRTVVSGRCVLTTRSEAGDDAETKARYEAEVKYSEGFDQLLRASGVEREADWKTGWLGSILVQLLPILLLVGLIYFLFSRQIKSAGRGALQFGKSRARLMSTEHVPITFSDVAGCDEAKEEMSEIVDFLKDPGKFQKIGGRIPKGVMMVGPPGTGKTLLARAVAGEAGVPFFSISGSDFVEMFVGVGASRVRDMFEEGKRHAPCLIFIDEIDAVGRSRFSGIGGGHDEREQTLNAMLAEMDGFEPS